MHQKLVWLIGIALLDGFFIKTKVFSPIVYEIFGGGMSRATRYDYKSFLRRTEHFFPGS